MKIGFQLCERLYQYLLKCNVKTDTNLYSLAGIYSRQNDWIKKIERENERKREWEKESHDKIDGIRVLHSNIYTNGERKNDRITCKWKQANRK